jgi:hypothetical protein
MPSRAVEAVSAPGYLRPLTPKSPKPLPRGRGLGEELWPSGQLGNEPAPALAGDVLEAINFPLPSRLYNYLWDASLTRFDIIPYNFLFALLTLSLAVSPSLRKVLIP